MFSVKDLIDEVGFQPEEIYLQDGEKTIKVDYRRLKEEFGYPLSCFLELVPVDEHVFYVDHSWKNEKDLHCNTTIIELLKRIDEEQNGVRNQKLSNYLLMIQDALKDLRSGDESGIMELVSLIEASEDF